MAKVRGITDYEARPGGGSSPPGVPGVYVYGDGRRELWLADPGTWENDPTGYYNVDVECIPGVHPDFGAYDATQVRRVYMDESEAVTVVGEPVPSWFGAGVVLS